MPKILKIFLFNFPNWSCLREHCAYPHFPMWKNHECCLTLNIFSPWVSGLAHHRHAFCLWEQSDANTQTLSGPLTLIRSLRCLEGQMVFVAISAPGLTPFTHSRLTGIGLWSIDPPKQKNPHLTTEICTYTYIYMKFINSTNLSDEKIIGNPFINMLHFCATYGMMISFVP